MSQTWLASFNVISFGKPIMAQSAFSITSKTPAKVIDLGRLKRLRDPCMNEIYTRMSFIHFESTQLHVQCTTVNGATVKSSLNVT